MVSKAPTVLPEDLQPETAALVAVVAGLIIVVASASSGSSVVFSGVSSASNAAAARDKVASTPCARIWLSRVRRPSRGRSLVVADGPLSAEHVGLAELVL